MPFGQDPVFFDMLDQQARIAVQAAQEFAAMGKDLGSREKAAQAIKKLETDGDELTHELVAKADAKFITPFDKEDFHALSHALDELTDLVEAAASRLVMYRLDQPRGDFGPMTALLQQSYQTVADAVGGLRQLKDHRQMVETLTGIHEAENQMDELYRKALSDLFNADKAEPILVMKWKEVYDRIELASDQSENVADILESLVVKYA